MKTTESKRIEWVDIARGIAIIFMMMGHSTIPQPLSVYIWSFHMPLFFVVSGLFFNPNKFENFQGLFRRKVRTLFVPYWFFTLVVFVGYYGTEYYKPYELYEGWEGYALWFVPVLLLTEMIFYPISKLKQSYIVIIVLLLTCLGYGLSLGGIKLPFKIECVPFALFFVGSGFLLKNIILPPPVPKWPYVVLIGIATITLSQFLPKLGIGRNEFGWFVPNLLNALLGVYFIFCVSKYLARRSKWIPIKLVHYFGENSLFVMAFSQVFNYWILTCFNHLGVSGKIGLVLRYALLFFLISLAAECLKRYLPFFVGQQLISKKRNEA